MLACSLGVCAALSLPWSCSRTPVPWQRDALQAEVILRGRDVDVRGRLTFVRPRSPDLGTLQLDVERDGHLDNATLLATGKTTAFTDGVPRPIRAAEERALAVLAALLAWPGTSGERRASGADSVVRLADGSEYTLTLGREVAPGAHHDRR